MTDNDFTIVLPVQGPPLLISYAETQPTISGLTGKNLMRCQISFTVAGDARNDEVNAALAAAHAGSQLISDTQGGQWKVSNWSESFQQGSQMYHYNVDLEEQEEITLTGVRIDSMTLVPERWSVDASDALRFLVSLDSADHRSFEQILERYLTAQGAERYFPVTLVGASDAAASWRFGQ